MGKVLTRLSLGGLVVLLVAFVIGCGGDDDDSSSGSESSASSEDTSAASTTSTTSEPEPVTKKEFIKEADAACKKAQAEFSQLLKQEAAGQAVVNKPETLADPALVKKAADNVATVVDKLADQQDQATKTLNKVETPPGEDILAKWTKLRDKAADEIRVVADAWRAYGQNPTQETADAIGTAAAKQQKLAAESRAFVKGYGFKTCGTAVEPPKS